MKKLILLCILFLTVTSYSQDTILKVIASKGSPILKTLGTEVSLKAGTIISTHGIIETSDADYLSLITKIGQTYEITSKGKYDTKEIENEVKIKKSFPQKFGSYLYEKLTEDNDKQKTMKMLGAVVRSRNDQLMVELPYSSFYDEDSIFIVWDKQSLDGSYILKFMNSEYRTLLLNKTSGNKYWLSVKNMKLRPGESYALVINTIGDRSLVSDTIMIKIPNKKLLAEINDGLKVSSENPFSAIDLIQSALIYEEGGFINNAKRMYEAAIAMAPGVDEYFQLYLRFLIKNRLEAIASAKIKENK